MEVTNNPSRPQSENGTAQTTKARAQAAEAVKRRPAPAPPQPINAFATSASSSTARPAHAAQTLSPHPSPARRQLISAYMLVEWFWWLGRGGARWRGTVSPTTSWGRNMGTTRTAPFASTEFRGRWCLSSLTLMVYQEIAYGTS